MTIWLLGRWLIVVLLGWALTTPNAAAQVWGNFEAPLPGVGNSIDAFIQQADPLVTYISLIANFILVFIIAIAILLMVLAGYIYMTAGGDGGRVQTAKDMIYSALLGLTVALVSYLLLNIISQQFTPVTDPIF